VEEHIMTLRRTIVLVVVAVVVAVAVAGTVVWRHLSADSSPVPVSTVLSEFKAAAGGSVTGPPRPGVYTYAVQGKECAGFAGLHLCRAFPSRARMILIRKPHTVSIEIDLSQDHLEASRYTVHEDGRYLTWERARIVIGIAQEDVTPTNPATLALPSALKIGMRWTQKFSAGGLPVSTMNYVKRQTTMKIAGSSLSVYEIDASSVTGGDHPGTETDVTYHSPATGLDTRMIVHRRIGGTFPYTMDVDATLLSLKPLE
jgi:hypothetical protein